MFSNPLPEIALHVLLSCTPREICHMEQSSSRFQLLVHEHEEQLWEMQLRRRWPIESHILLSLVALPRLTHRKVFKSFATRVRLDPEVCQHMYYSPFQDNAWQINQNLIYIVRYNNVCGLAKWGTNSDGYYSNGTDTQGSNNGIDKMHHACLCWSPPVRTIVVNKDASFSVKDNIINSKTFVHVLDKVTLKCVTIVDGTMLDGDGGIEKITQDYPVDNFGEVFKKNSLIGYGDIGVSIFGYEIGDEYAENINTIIIPHPSSQFRGEGTLPDNMVCMSVQINHRFRPMATTEYEYNDGNDSCFLYEVSIDFGNHGQPLASGLPVMEVRGAIAALVDQSTTTLRSIGGRDEWM